MTNDELTKLIALAQRTSGWNFREYRPQCAPLVGGYRLIVVPPWLWRPRAGSRPRPMCAPILMRRAK